MDHTIWALQTRWFAWHGYGVLAVDLPGHGKSEGSALETIEEMAALDGEANRCVRCRKNRPNRPFNGIIGSFGGHARGWRAGFLTGFAGDSGGDASTSRLARGNEIQ